MRPLLLPGLLDAARHNAAHGAGDVALFESAHVYGAETATSGRPRAARAGATPAAERHHLAALLTVARPAGWRTPAVAADFYAAKGVLEGVLGAAGVPFEVERRRGHSCTPAAPRRVTAGGDEIGWIGELHPLVACAWDLDGGAAFEIDADALARLAPGPAVFADLTSFPAVLQDIAVVVPAERHGRRGRARRRGGRRRAARRVAGVRRLRGRAGRRGQPVARAAPRVPRARPDADRRRGCRAARRDRGRARRRSGGGSVAEARIAVAGASGFAGALAAAIVDRHPDLELTARHGARRRRPQAVRPLPAPPGRSRRSPSSTPTLSPRPPTP